MRITALATVAIALAIGSLHAQEPKPVPKDSVRLSLPGCTKGYVFTAGPRTPDQPGSVYIPEGTHLRMNAPKKLISQIKAHEGSMVEITGIMKKTDLIPDGVGVGGVRIRPGRGPNSGSLSGTPIGGQISIDVESVRPVVGACRTR